MDTQMRNMFITLNNWTEEEYVKLSGMKGVKYYVIGKECGEQGTPHLQGYFEFTGGKRLSTIKKLLPRIHIEKRKGTPKQASDYCKKEGNYVEFGELSKQGERNDLNEIKDSIINGKTVPFYGPKIPCCDYNESVKCYSCSKMDVLSV